MPKPKTIQNNKPFWAIHHGEFFLGCAGAEGEICGIPIKPNERYFSWYGLNYGSACGCAKAVDNHAASHGYDDCGCGG